MKRVANLDSKPPQKKMKKKKENKVQNLYENEYREKAQKIKELLSMIRQLPAEQRGNIICMAKSSIEAQD